MFSGSLVALVTPFKNNAVDEQRLGDLVEWHIKSGTHGIVPCGTTGESATLSHQEHTQVVKLVVEAAGKRIPVVAGTGSNSTAEAIQMTCEAQEIGGRRRAHDLTVLQPTAARRHLPALQGGGRGGPGLPHRLLQYPEPNGLEYPA